MSRVNPEALLHAATYGTPAHEVFGRCTGKTTAAILRAVAAAHESPGRAQPVLDPDLFPNQHCQVHVRCSPERARHVRHAAEDIIARLGLTRVSVGTDYRTNVPTITSTFAVDI